MHLSDYRPVLISALAYGLGLLFALNVYSFYKAIEILRVPLAILVFYVNPLNIGVLGALVVAGIIGTQMSRRPVPAAR